MRNSAPTLQIIKLLKKINGLDIIYRNTLKRLFIILQRKYAIVIFYGSSTLLKGNMAPCGRSALVEPLPAGRIRLGADGLLARRRGQRPLVE
jgi:hypothetical protein